MTTTTKKLFGLVFTGMSSNDWDAFAGAAEGTLIHYSDDEETVLLYDPNAETVTEIILSEDLTDDSRTWQLVSHN